MITEDYVSFETAKLLKEKGFDVPCFAYYYVMPHKTVIAYDKDFLKNSDLCFIYANMEFGSMPTLQMAMKWLREEKKLYVNVLAKPKDVENNDFRTIYRMHVYDGASNYGTSEFSKYEEACEAAIKYCLENLI